MYVWMYVCMYVCMYGCMYVCMYVWMYVCMYACMSTVYREIFAVKKFYRSCQQPRKLNARIIFNDEIKTAPKLRYAKFHTCYNYWSKEWNREDGFVKMATTQKRSSWSKRFIVVLNTIPGNCCSKSRSGTLRIIETVVRLVLIHCGQHFGGHTCRMKDGILTTLFW